MLNRDLAAAEILRCATAETVGVVAHRQGCALNPPRFRTDWRQSAAAQLKVVHLRRQLIRATCDGSDRPKRHCGFSVAGNRLATECQTEGTSTRRLCREPEAADHHRDDHRIPFHAKHSFPPKSRTESHWHQRRCLVRTVEQLDSHKVPVFHSACNYHCNNEIRRRLSS